MPGIAALGKHFFSLFLNEPPHRGPGIVNIEFFNTAESPLSVPFLG